MEKKLSLQAEMIQIQESWKENMLFVVKELFHVYKTKYIETIALKDLNLEIIKGEFIGILGASGSGKTTFMNIISGLLEPTTGRIYFKNNSSDNQIINIAQLNLEERTTYRRNNIGYIFQDFKLFDYLTVEENIQIPLLIRSIDLNKNESNINEMMEICNIEHRRNYKIEQLSGGEKQRVQVASSLIGKPQIILADEPTGNLDSINSCKIFELLKYVSKKYNTTVLTVTHDTRIENYCDRIISFE